MFAFFAWFCNHSQSSFGNVIFNLWRSFPVCCFIFITTNIIQNIVQFVNHFFTTKRNPPSGFRGQTDNNPRLQRGRKHLPTMPTCPHRRLFDATTNSFSFLAKHTIIMSPHAKKGNDYVWRVLLSRAFSPASKQAIFTKNLRYINTTGDFGCWFRGKKGKTLVVEDHHPCIFSQLIKRMLQQNCYQFRRRYVSALRFGFYSRHQVRRNARNVVAVLCYSRFEYLPNQVADSLSPLLCLLFKSLFHFLRYSDVQNRRVLQSPSPLNAVLMLYYKPYDRIELVFCLEISF